MNTDTYQIITDRILERLQAGVIPWKHYSNLRSEESAPRNLVSGRPYHGVNYFLLSMMGHKSPYWLTFKQAKDLGGFVRKGEHSMSITYWNFVTVEDKDKRQGEVSSREKQIPFLRYYSVFNSSQVEGIDAKIPDLPTPRETTANKEAERIVGNMPNRPAIVNGPFPIACYVPSEDKVKMTEQKLCVSDERYYEVLLHELTHSTGHPPRLNREKEMGGWHSFGSREYSKE
jgi:antirestriction protein ArdC